MYISTKGCYAIIALVDLWQVQKKYGVQRPVALNDLSKRLNLSSSYLEQIFAGLRQGGIVRSMRGPGGGYVLSKDAKEIKLDEIINCVSVSLVDKMCDSAVASRRGDVVDEDPTKNLWQSLGKHIEAYMSNVDLASVADGRVKLDGMMAVND